MSTTTVEKRKVRCKAHKSETGEPCGKWAITGLEVCRAHGGATAAAVAKAEAARLTATMVRFATPVERDDPEANPIEAFMVDYRRTVGRIRWYDEQMAEMTQKQLIWGRTKKEEIGATEFAGKNTTYEARANILHELQFRERTHLLALSKVWIGARLDERKLDIQRAYVRALDQAIVGILTRLGQDIADPGVRQVVREELLALPMRQEKGA